MASRGGYRSPSGGPRAAGVGRASQRTDAGPIKVPNVGDSTDLTHGDRQKLEAAQRAVPIGKTPPTQVRPPAQAAGMPTGGGGNIPPEFLFSMPGPDAPMEMPREPEDEIEIVLRGMAQITGDPGIMQDLAEHREFKAWKASGQQTQPVAPEPMMEPEVEADEPTNVVDVAATPETEPVEPPLEEGGDEVVGTGVLPSQTGGDTEMV